MPLNRVDLPAPFGPTTATSAPVSTAPLEMMHCRVALIAERKITEQKFWHGYPFSVNGPQHRCPDQCDQHAGDCDPLRRREPQQGWRDRRGWVGRAAVMVVVHECNNITLHFRVANRAAAREWIIASSPRSAR